MTQFKTLVAVLLGGIATAATAVTPLQTVVTATPAASQSGLQTATAKDANGTRTTTAAPAAAAGVSLAQFDTARAILLGASVSVDTPVAATARVTGSVEDSGSGRTITADTALTGTVSGGGVSFSSGALTASRACSGGNCGNSPQNNSATTNGSIKATMAVPLASLGTWAGTGTVTLAQNVSGSTKATNGARAKQGTAEGLFAFGSATPGNNKYAVTYDWLNFAAPAFDANGATQLDLDFGSLYLGSAPVTLHFSLTNLGDANSADARLDSVTASGSADFASNLAPFAALAGGSSAGFDLSFTPQALGSQSAALALNLSDVAPAGSIGGRSYVLNINALANVLEAPAAVPEPASWAMLITGFALVGLGQRRQRVLRLPRVSA